MCALTFAWNSIEFNRQKRKHTHIGASLTVRVDTLERFPSFNILGKRETSAWHISIVSLPKPSFILPLVLSSVHLINIKSWFMEMSAREREKKDPSIRKQKSWWLQLLRWFIKFTELFNTLIVVAVSVGHGSDSFMKLKHRFRSSLVWKGS